jgi:metal-responsive CopG/Arc/MetJ family transcriptional regulator
MEYEPRDLPPPRVAEIRRMLRRAEKKEKVSLTLSAELVRAADLIAGKARRSALVERALRGYLGGLLRRSRDRHDRELIDAKAQVTNRESDKLLALQAWPE